MARSRFRLPDKIRIISLYGIDYYIEWEKMLPGRSFFLQTTATAKDVQKQLRPVEQYYNFKVKAVQRCEFGYYGVRVWRVA
jgi:hypothetical protein